MTSLLLDPHGDDAVLFASYLCLSERPHVVVWNPTVPKREIQAAMDIFNLSWTVWGQPTGNYDRIIAPAYHKDGHDEHNKVHALALACGKPVTEYLTYAPRGERSRNGREAWPEPWMIGAKLRALGCFQSQIEQASTRPWFYDLLDMREWIA